MSDVWNLTKLIADAREYTYQLRTQIEGARVYVRERSDAFYLDQVYAAHFSRIFLSAENVFVLASMGSYADASCVSRSIIEHTINLAFIDSHDDAVGAAYVFILSGGSHIVEVFEHLQKHYPEQVKPSEQYAKTVDHWRRALRHLGFKSGFKSQIEHLDRLSNGNPELSDKAYAYIRDLIYAEMSLHAHPRSIGLQSYLPQSSETVTFREVGTDRTAVLAVFGAAFCTSAAAEIARQTWGISMPLPFAGLNRLLEEHSLAEATLPTIDFIGAAELSKIKVPPEMKKDAGSTAAKRV